MSQAAIAVIVFILVMILIISEKVHRAAAAIGGAALLFITGILSVEQGAGYVDFNTIGILTGMMIFVAVVKNSGIFEYVAVKSAKLAGGSPWRIMMIFMVVTALLSALLDNVTTVLLIGPMTLAITKSLRINPVPFFITQIFASNIGGTTTLIGDPPNIMIGSAAGLTFMDFILNNGLIIVIVLVVTILGFKFIYGNDLAADKSSMSKIMMMDERNSIKNRVLLYKSVVMILAVIAGFVMHNNLELESSVIALAAAAVMMIIGKQNIEEVILDVEWPTILFFIGLFIVVGGMVETGVIDRLAGLIMGFTGDRPVMTIIIVLWVAALLSSTLDNIPFVATMIPLIISLGENGMDIMPLWWALSLGACLGGNGTLIGASANVVLSGISGKHGYPITYIEYLKVGFPMMLVSIVICTAYLLVRYG